MCGIVGFNWEDGQNARKYVADNHDVGKIVGEYKKLFVGFLPDRTDWAQKSATKLPGTGT